jgi:hypothetical protein
MRKEDDGRRKNIQWLPQLESKRRRRVEEHGCY